MRGAAACTAASLWQDHEAAGEVHADVEQHIRSDARLELIMTMPEIIIVQMVIRCSRGRAHEAGADKSAHEAGANESAPDAGTHESVHDAGAHGKGAPKAGAHESVHEAGAHEERS